MPVKMRVFIVIGVVCGVLFTACEKEAKPAPASQEFSQAVIVPTLIKLEASHEAELNRWGALRNLETEVARFERSELSSYKVSIEDLVRLEGELAISEFPEKFNTPAVKSRITVFKTYLLQTKWLLSKAGTDKSIMIAQKAKILESFNALKRQLSGILAKELAEQFLKDIEE